MAPFIEARHYTEREESSDYERSTLPQLSPTTTANLGGASKDMTIPLNPQSVTDGQNMRFPSPTPNSSSNLESSKTTASTSVSALPPTKLPQSGLSGTTMGTTSPNAYPTGDGSVSSSWLGGNRGPYKPTYGSDEIPVSKVVMAVMIPLVLLGLASALLLAYFRRRKRRRNRAGIQPQVKRPSTNRTPVTTAHAHYAAPPPEPAPANSFQSPPTEPVLLSSVIPMSSYYNTGIDTSDAISLASANNQPQQNISETMYAETIEEPPPPYRPRSVPPASGQSSVRNPASHQATLPVTLSETNLMAHDLEGDSMRTEDPRSPFADPVDGDGVSISSGQGRGDRLSAVSDLSYQEDPPPAHEHV